MSNSATGLVKTVAPYRDGSPRLQRQLAEVRRRHHEEEQRHLQCAEILRLRHLQLVEVPRLRQRHLVEVFRPRQRHLQLAGLRRHLVEARRRHLEDILHRLQFVDVRCTSPMRAGTRAPPREAEKASIQPKDPAQRRGPAEKSYQQGSPKTDRNAEQHCERGEHVARDCSLHHRKYGVHEQLPLQLCGHFRSEARNDLRVGPVSRPLCESSAQGVLEQAQPAGRRWRIAARPGACSCPRTHVGQHEQDAEVGQRLN